MKRMLLTAVILCGLIVSVVAQKRNSLIGDFVIGEVASADAATREITIKYPGKEGMEVFSGVLASDDTLKIRGISVREITPGIQVRVLYKSEDEKINGQKKKINRILILNFLGKDEFVRLRDQLKVDPSTAFVHAANANLPSNSPLKVYLANAYSDGKQDLTKWVTKWNGKNGETYGRLELVSALEQADILIVTAEGSDTMIATFPDYQGRDTKGGWSQATSYVVVKDPEGLKVLWIREAPVWSNEAKTKVVSLKSTKSIISEMEKRMKARTGNVKK